MKLSRKVGSTSQILQVFIRDSSSTTGGGLTGLVYNSGSLTAYYHRDTDTTATAISLVTMTVGTFTSSGFKEIDATNMPGHYQFCPPNAAFNTGATSVMFHLKGATNMAPLPIEIDLDSQVDITALFGNQTSASNMQRSTAAIVTGTVGASSTTTSIITSALSPAAAATDQFKGRIVTFDYNTTTANLRGQATDITGSSSGGTLTVTALTTAPASGDTFTIT